MFVPLLLIILLCLGVLAAPAPVPQDPTPAIQDLPTGPTTKVYTWTYPSTQTKTVTYGGADWTTYLAVTTVDGSQVVETIVAPTDVPLHPGRPGANDEEEGEVKKEERKEGGVSCAIVGPVVAAGVLIIGVLAYLLYRRRGKTMAARKAKTAVVKVKVTPDDASEVSTIVGEDAKKSLEA